MSSLSRSLELPRVPGLPCALYLVGTPIGNLEDLTFRALRILQTVDLIAAEDTRHTGKLLHHFQIKTPQISYHDHNRTSRIPLLLERLQQGQRIALVSDAGMPGISDPGYELVVACREAGIGVVPIPGVSAVLTALCASGLPSDRFVFEGFLPAKRKARQDHLQALKLDPRTLVFYESPHRLRESLQDLAVVLGGDRSIVLARELTKLHEEFWRGSIEDAIAHSQTVAPLGEYTLVVSGAPSQTTPPPSDSDLRQALQILLAQGIPRSEASRHLAQATGLPKRQIYQLSLQGEPDPPTTPNSDTLSSSPGSP